MLYLFLLSIALSLFLFPKFSNNFLNTVRSHFFPKLSYQKFLFFSRICLGLVVVASFVVFADPAHAQFYSKTQTWLETSFAGAGGTNTAGIKTAIGLIFNVLRALFVIYLGIALVRVIVAARNDDDWQQLARIPLILVLAVTLGDLLAGLIIGNGTTTP